MIGERDIFDNPTARDTFGPATVIFRTRYLPGTRIELRPIASSAPDNMVGILYLKSGDVYRQSGIGCCSDGAWRRRRRGQPLVGDFYWSLMVNEKDEAPLLLGVKAGG